VKETGYHARSAFIVAQEQSTMAHNHKSPEIEEFERWQWEQGHESFEDWLKYHLPYELRRWRRSGKDILRAFYEWADYNDEPRAVWVWAEGMEVWEEEQDDWQTWQALRRGEPIWSEDYKRKVFEAPAPEPAPEGITQWRLLWDGYTDVIRRPGKDTYRGYLFKLVQYVQMPDGRWKKLRERKVRGSFNEALRFANGQLGPAKPRWYPTPVSTRTNQERVHALRRDHPDWGIRKIADALKAETGKGSYKTVRKMLAADGQ
jgi:hypothetical protein